MVVGQQTDDNGETQYKPHQYTVFLLQERHGAFCDGTVNGFQSVTAFLVETKIERNRGDLFHVEEGDCEPEQGQRNDQ